MKFIILIKKAVITLTYNFLSIFVRRNEKYLAFGSWGGKLYADNSKYLLEECIKRLDETFHFIWIGNKELEKIMPDDKRIDICEKDSLITLFKLLKCKFFFSSQLASIDISSYNIFWKAKLVLLYHGFPIKKIGDDTKKVKKGKSHIAYDYFLSSSTVHTEKLLSAFKNIGCKPEKILSYGTPRNDFLYNLSDSCKNDIMEEFKNKYGIPIEKKVILYMPTFRRSGIASESLWYRENENEKKELLELLEKHNYVLVEKVHFAEQQRGKASRDNYSEYYFNLNSDFDSQKLLVCSDVLISDYSSALIDFLILDRPIIHYVYDYVFYKNTDSGLYFELDDFSCGEVALNFNELITILQKVLTGEDSCKELRRSQKNRFLEYENGTASINLIENIITRS